MPYVPHPPPQAQFPKDKAARVAMFRRFVDEEHAGNQARAAEALRLHRSMVQRLYAGEREVTPKVAEAAERASDARFPKEAFLWPHDHPVPPARKVAVS